jgi:hypothetical protein
MKSMRKAHVVVVGANQHGLMVAARLRRMALARVTAVEGLAEARSLCERGEAQACIVVSDDGAPEQLSMPVADAPGRGSGVPSPIMVPAMTPYVRKAARRDGYMAALPVNVSPRTLYRRIGAALQGKGRGAGRRQASALDRKRLPLRAGSPALTASLPLQMAKPTLH